MLNASKEFKELIRNGNRNYKLYIDIETLDGAQLHLTNSDIWQGSFSIDDAVSSDDQFDVGAAIINKLDLTINNIYDEFSEYDFGGAKVVAYVGLQLDEDSVENPRIEKLRKGTFEVDEPKYNGATISLSCLDNMRLFDRSYSESVLAYPATLEQIVLNACLVCGVTLGTTTFPNMDFLIPNRPNDEATTFREVISWVAQISGCFARCDVYGRLEIKWFNQEFLDTENLDGGYFDKDDSNIYVSGDDADGGTFNPWNIGYVYDSGDFLDCKSYHHLYRYTSLDISTDNVNITGIRVCEKSNASDSQNEIINYDVGQNGYVVSIENNDLITAGIGEQVANYLGQKLIGMKFRKASISHLSDPTIEAGDIAYFTDKKQNSYRILVSRTTFTTGGFQTTVSSAETPQKNSDVRYSAQTKNYVESRKNAKQQLSTYDLAVQQLTSLITQSFGVFKTEEALEDGSTVFYLHNKPTLAESGTIWKMTADAFAVSTDGGQTWNAGMDASGNAVVNVLSAIGINAEWINTGTMTANRISGGTLTLGGAGNGDGVCIVKNQAGKTIATLEKDGIVMTMDDGSKIVINPSVGFYQLVGSSRREYHNLFYSQEVTFPAVSSGAGVTFTYITLPDEFKGKTVNATISISKMVTNHVPSTFGAVMGCDVNVMYDSSKNQIRAGGSLNVWDLENGGWHSQNQYLKAVVTVTA